VTIYAAEPAFGDTGAVSLGTRVMRQVAARYAPIGAFSGRPGAGLWDG
jgi:hypothetical protein